MTPLPPLNDRVPGASLPGPVRRVSGLSSDTSRRGKLIAFDATAMHQLVNRNDRIEFFKLIRGAGVSLKAAGSFWDLSRTEREQLMVSIIDKAGGAQELLNAHPMLIMESLEMFIPSKTDPHDKTRTHIHDFYYDHLRNLFTDSYELAIFLLALMRVFYKDKAREYKGADQVKFGYMLADFLKELGAIKLAQKLDSFYQTPVEWNAGLSRCKDQAEPMSEQLFMSLAKDVLPKELFDNSNIGELIGAGSYLDTREIKLDKEYRKKNKPYSDLDPNSKLVLQLVKPAEVRKMQIVLGLAKRLSQSSKGSATTNPISRFVQGLSPILEYLHDNFEEEVNMERAKDKALAFSEIYKPIKVTTPNLNLRYQTPGIFDHGRDYRINLLLEGKHFADLDESKRYSRKVKREIAAGILMTELFLIFTGQAFDHDRHDKNQKIQIQANGKGVIVGNFDENGLIKAPTDNQKRIFANLCMDALERSVKNNEEIISAISDVFKEVQNKPQLINDEDRDFIRAVADAVLSLMNYTKMYTRFEKKGRSVLGGVIKVPRFLAMLLNVMFAVYRTGKFDLIILDTFKTRYQQLKLEIPMASPKHVVNKVLLNCLPMLGGLASHKWSIAS